MLEYEKHRSEKDRYLYMQSSLDLTFHAHLHHSFELVYVKEGLLHLTISGTTFRMERGQAALILPNQIHAYESPGRSRTKLCIFSTDFVRDFYRQCQENETHWPVFTLEDPGLLLAGHREELPLYRIKSYLYRIADLYTAGPAWQAPPLASDGAAQALIRYLEEHYSESMTLRAAAAALGYDYHYLSGLIHRCFQTNFSRLLNEYRIEHAKYLLLSGEDSITEISEQCGYDSQRSFNRNFLLLTGVTPGAFRKGKTS